jgi:hypothetical protein
MASHAETRRADTRLQVSSRRVFLRRLGKTAAIGLGLLALPDTAFANEEGRCCPSGCMPAFQCSFPTTVWWCDGCGSGCCVCIYHPPPEQCFSSACPCG